ncbi:peptidoglycan recognition protein family protein [Kangiella marina]|uniref:N-acetylmuramoyl-L-alanine amidase n=1 Tax=Kangiella marina TaxID=1079178 RepID=A0ABP8INK1_9GAMM
MVDQNDAKIESGKLLHSKVEHKVYKGLHKGDMNSPKAIVVHQTGAATAQHTFNSYTSSPHGAHFLISKTGKIYQTALINKYTYHVGKLRSRCIETNDCSKAELAKANAIYLKKGESYGIRVKKLHKHELGKNYPDRYPSNTESIGIEIVGDHSTKNGYETVNALQNTSLEWLVAQLNKLLCLEDNDVYRHPEVSYKQSSEASSAKW